MKNFKRTIIYMLVFVALAALTVYVMVTQTKSFSLNSFGKILSEMNPVWIILAFLGMIGFVFFEGFAIVIILRVFGYKRRLRRGWFYAAPDVYFSAITPSATGGQPASLYFMHKDKVPAAVSTIALLLNLIFYIASVLILSLVCLILCPTVLGEFDPFSMTLITIGFITQLVLMAIFILLVYKSIIVKKMANGLLRFAKKLHLIKNMDKKLKKLDDMEEQYKECADLILKNKATLSKAFLCNFLQRVSQVLISVFVFLGVQGWTEGHKDILRSFSVQGFVALGSNAVPIPGAIGAADYLYVDGFADLLKDPVSVELVSRGISFYVCVLLCGIFTLTAYSIYNFRGKKRK